MKRLLRLFCAFVFFALPCVCARAEDLPSVRLNEICSGNGGHYTIGGSAPDYIELFSLGGQAAALDGLFISDDEDHLQKYALEGRAIPEGGYLILAADKKELPFKLSASGGEELFLSDGDGHILQRVALPPLEKDTTYSLQENGEWHITAPTPLAENAEGTPYVKKAYVAAPRFSHGAGFYSAPFQLTLDSYKTYKVYYTTDGSAPDENATLYTAPISIEDATSRPNALSARTDILISDATPPSEPVKKAAIIRAVAIDPDGNRSNEVTNAYFVGFQRYDAYQHIPVLSIVAEPSALFDEQDGIYVRGKVYQEWLSDENRNQALEVQRIPANYRMHGKEWEIPVDIQWFDEDNVLRLSQGAGVRIHGNWSREQPKKSFNLYARGEYGANTIGYDLLAGLPGKEKVVVRANLGKDSLIHALLRETGLPVSPCTPCLVFINGEFWGLYEIREKQDEKDIAGFFGLNAKDLLVIKNKELDAGEPPEGTKSTGVRAVYNDLLAAISRLDASVPQEYEALDALIDVDNYITYMAGITYLNNSDYRNNFTMWRTAEKGGGPYQDARWRWIFQDLDYCCYIYDGLIDSVTYLPEDVIFSSLWKNSAFQTKFLTRVMDFANVELETEYVRAFITPTLTYYNPYLKETYNRFPGNSVPANKPGAKQISDMMAFFQTRREAVIAQLTETLKLSRGTSALTLSGLPEGFTLQVNGHEAHLTGNSWSGVYFTGCSVRVEAGSIPGYEFDGWYEENERITENQTLVLSTDTARTLTPVYKALPVIVAMDKTEIIYGTGRNGFSKPLRDSLEECALLPDDTVRAEHKYMDYSILFQLDASVKGPQGFTLSLPLRNYESAGGAFTLSVPENSGALTWRVRARNGSNAYRELAVDSASLPGGLLRLAFTLPADQLDNQPVDIRLEAEMEKGPASFSLRGFLVYGVPMEPALARAREYALAAKGIGAEARYLPDLERMAAWSPEEIDAETASLREQLQAEMAQRALSAVGALNASSPVWEGLEAYPAVTVDAKLIQAFYNQDTVDLNVSADAAIYLYEAAGDALRFQSVRSAEGGVLRLNKRAGVFFLLDRPVESLRFRAGFDAMEIPPALLSSAFFDVSPQKHLWLSIETFTRHQEEAALDLPEGWRNRPIFIYRLRDGELAFYAEAAAQEGALRITPEEGRYLLLDEPLESFAQEAQWLKQEIEDLARLRAQEEQRRAKRTRSIALIGGGVFAVIAAGTVLALVLRRKRK